MCSYKLREVDSNCNPCFVKIRVVKTTEKEVNIYKDFYMSNRYINKCLPVLKDESFLKELYEKTNGNTIIEIGKSLINNRFVVIQKGEFKKVVCEIQSYS